MPTGIPAYKIAKSPELREIARAMKVLQDRAKAVNNRDRQKERILRLCIASHLTRREVGWVYDNLPKMYVTRKDRAANLAANLLAEKREKKRQYNAMYQARRRELKAKSHRKLKIIPPVPHPEVKIDKKPKEE
jgi:hypothetical protein